LGKTYREEASMSRLSRRDWLKAGGAAAGLLAMSGGRAAAEETPKAGEKPVKERWLLGINSSTIRPANIETKISAAAKAGYDTIELWNGELAEWEKSGKPIEDLGKRIKDSGLVLANVIGLWDSMPPNDADKPKTYERLKVSIAQAAKAGARHIAAIPTPNRPDMNLLWAARRYAELIDLGKEFGIPVAVEFVGFTQTVHTLGQAACVACEADRPEACLVADTFHVWRGGGNFGAARFLSGSLFAVWHFNDVPAQPERSKLNDSDRIYPGDGILPLAQLLKDLWANGFRGPLSLELFNNAEYKRDPAEVAKTGIEKMRSVIAKAGVGV
jgi:sugar phosphate isomerase/epimerase